MFTIALIGRTNVGKSTLFNRILGERRAITSELPHTTRDRTVGATAWRGVTLRCIDTGGVTSLTPSTSRRAHAPPAHTSSIEDEIRTQVAYAIAEAQLLLFVTDVRDGLLPDEIVIAQELRKRGTPLLLVCNKVETPRLRNACYEFAALGLGDPIPVSAKSGAGVGDLLDAVVHAQQSASHHEEHTPPSDLATENVSRGIPTYVAIVGEPNVGKSSLVNAILGRDEVIVRPEPYTTRDVHDVALEHDGHPVVLVDTAGIRRAATRSRKVVRKRIEHIERESVTKSLAAIERADVAVLVLDVTQTATRHVKQLAQAIVDARRACVIAMNKIDVVGDIDEERTIASLHHLLPHLSWAPVLFTSATAPTNVHTIMPAALGAARNWRQLLPGDQLAQIYTTAKRSIPTPKDREGARQVRTINLVQVGAQPPQFLLRTRRRVKLPRAIVGIMERALRTGADFTGTPIVVTAKSVKV